MELLALIGLFAILGCLASVAPARRGYRINDLSRWEAFGGTLKRPPPPPPFRNRPVRED